MSARPAAARRAYSPKYLPRAPFRDKQVHTRASPAETEFAPTLARLLRLSESRDRVLRVALASYQPALLASVRVSIAPPGARHSNSSSSTNPLSAILNTASCATMM